ARVHALSRQELEGLLCGLAAYCARADEVKTPCHQARVVLENARTIGAGRSLAEAGSGRVLPLSRRAGEPFDAFAIPRTDLPLLAACIAPLQLEAETRLGTSVADL
ncbi:MAG: hypothetical protein ACK5TN_08920, partial [Acidobacteriota bacterium]